MRRLQNMLSINKIHGAYNEFEINISGREVGHVQLCDGGEYDMIIFSNENENSALAIGDVKNFDEIIPAFENKIIEIHTIITTNTNEISQLDHDMHSMKHYITMKTIADEISKRKDVINKYLQFWYADFNYLIREDDNHEA